MSESLPRNRRRNLVGEVVSRSGDKTLKMIYFYKIPHPLYKKEIKRKTVLHVHDENNEASVGDKIEIMETRPLSKMKRFRLLRITEKAPSIGA